MLARSLTGALLCLGINVQRSLSLPQGSTACNALADTTFDIEGTKILGIATVVSLDYTIPATAPFLPMAVEGLNICQAIVSYNHDNAPTPVNLTLYLPLSDWNGRFLGVGGSGFAAGIPVTMGPFAKLGYATASTDAGLPGGGDPASPATWALLPDGSVNLELLENFGSRSVHDLAVIGRAVAERFYGKPPKQAYWSGCSTGGRQALMAAQRYPEDFDGIVAGAPANYWAQYVIAEHWPQTVMKVLETYPPSCVLDFFAAAAVEACDALDGVVDFVIGDIATCRQSGFMPSAYLGAQVPCGQQNITIDESTVEVVTKILEGPEYWYGLNPGAPLSFLANTTEVNGTRTGLPFFVNSEWIRYFLQQDGAYDTANIDPSELAALFRASVGRYDHIIGAADPDLSSFQRTGGKLVVWHGESDQLIFPQGSVRYFEAVKDSLSGGSQGWDDVGQSSDFHRLFLAPGVDHCGQGLTSGAAPVDPLSAVVEWFEAGVAPDILPAAFPGDSEPQRKLCPYPMTSVYMGGESTSDVDDWICA